VHTIHLSLKTSAKIITFKAEYSMHIYHESKDKFLPLTIYRLPEIYILQAFAHHPAIPAANIAALTRENFEIQVSNITDRCLYC